MKTSTAQVSYISQQSIQCARNRSPRPSQWARGCQTTSWWYFFVFWSYSLSTSIERPCPFAYFVSRNYALAFSFAFLSSQHSVRVRITIFHYPTYRAVRCKRLAARLLILLNFDTKVRNRVGVAAQLIWFIKKNKLCADDVTQDIACVCHNAWHRLACCCCCKSAFAVLYKKYGGN